MRHPIVLRTLRSSAEGTHAQTGHAAAVGCGHQSPRLVAVDDRDTGQCQQPCADDGLEQRTGGPDDLERRVVGCEGFARDVEPHFGHRDDVGAAARRSSTMPGNRSVSSRSPAGSRMWPWRPCGTPPRSQVSVSDLAADIIAVLDHAGLRRAHVVGVSRSGLLAQELAIEHPGRVRRLVLASTTPGWIEDYPFPLGNAWSCGAGSCSRGRRAGARHLALRAVAGDAGAQSRPGRSPQPRGRHPGGGSRHGESGPAARAAPRRRRPAKRVPLPRRPARLCGPTGRHRGPPRARRPHSARHARWRRPRRRWSGLLLGPWAGAVWAKLSTGWYKAAPTSTPASAGCSTRSSAAWPATPGRWPHRPITWAALDARCRRWLVTSSPTCRPDG